MTERTTQSNVAKKTDIVTLQLGLENVKDLIDRLDHTIDRLDHTIEKLVSVNEVVTKLLAVHEHRLELQETLLTRLTELVEKRRYETTDAIDKIRTIIDEKDEKLAKNFAEYNETINERVIKLEKFTYILVGGSAIVSWLISKLNIAALLSIN